MLRSSSRLGGVCFCRLHTYVRAAGILGLTVLAWGNSVGDFIADTSLARAGNPRMGAASCFGSPLFNLLIGFGLSVTFATADGSYVKTPDDANIPASIAQPKQRPAQRARLRVRCATHTRE